MQKRTRLIGFLSLLSVAALAACDSGPKELTIDSKEFAWRYTASRPYLKSKLSVNRLTPIVAGERLLVAEEVRTKSTLQTRLSIARLDERGNRTSSEDVLTGIDFEFRGRKLLLPIDGGGPSQRGRYLLARYDKPSGGRAISVSLSILTFDGNGRIAARTKPAVVNSLYGVNAAWMDPAGNVVVAGSDATEKHFPLRLLRMTSNGEIDWQVLPSGVGPGKKFLSSTGFVSGAFSSDGSIALIGTDGHFHEGRPNRDIYRMVVDRNGRVSELKSLFAFPRSVLTEGKIRGLAVTSRPLLFSVRRRADRGFVGLVNGYYRGKRDGLRVVAVTDQGTMSWLKTHGEKVDGQAVSLSLGRNGTILAAARFDKTDYLYLVSSKGELIAEYRLKDLAVDRVERHPKSGFLISARRRDAKGDERLNLLHFKRLPGDG